MSGNPNFGPKPDSSKPGNKGHQEAEYTANGAQILDALVKEVIRELDVQKAANKPYDPHLHALMMSLYDTRNAMLSDWANHDMEWQKHEIVDKLWSNLSDKEIHKGEIDKDPFFQDAERFMNDVEYYEAPDPETAAEDFAKEWMESYRTNKEISALNAGVQPPVDEAGKLNKLIGDHDHGLGQHPEQMTPEEYQKYQSNKRDIERRQAIADGRTELPKWMADFSADEIKNIVKIQREQEQSQKARELKQRKEFIENGGKNTDFSEDLKEKEVSRKVTRDTKLEKDKNRPKKFWLHQL